MEKIQLDMIDISRLCLSKDFICENVMNVEIYHVSIITFILEKIVQKSIQERHQNILSTVEEDGMVW